jgi:hypothetical protein
MQKKDGKTYLDIILHFLGQVLQSPILEWIGPILDVIKDIRQRFSIGLYEVLEFETTLELLDPKGKSATVNKRQKVRYLQDHIIAYQDQAWGDGEILVSYQCSPGIPVDQYPLGHKTIILISLRKEKNKGDIDEFNMQWDMKYGFIKKVESWSTVIQHKTKRLKVKIIFPKSRPPQRVTLIESKSRKATAYGDDYKFQLPDGRWQVTLERINPKMYEEYLLEWKW